MKKKKTSRRKSPVSETKSKEPQLFKLSASKVGSFETCPAKYYYQYILKLPQKYTHSKSLGKYTHKIFEEFVRNYLKTSKIDESMDKAIKTAKVSLHYFVTPQIVNDSIPWIASFAQKIKTEGVPNYLSSEVKISFPINNEFIVNGYIDRVDKIGDKTIKIVDYKSTGYRNFLKPFQLATYGIAAKFGPYKDYKITMSYSLMRFEFEEVEYELTDEEIDKTINKFITTGRDIKKLVEKEDPLAWKAKPSKLCQYCDYRIQCDQDRQCGWDFDK